MSSLKVSGSPRVSKVSPRTSSGVSVGHRIKSICLARVKTTRHVSVHSNNDSILVILYNSRKCYRFPFQRHKYYMCPSNWS